MLRSAFSTDISRFVMVFINIFTKRYHSLIFWHVVLSYQQLLLEKLPPGTIAYNDFPCFHNFISFPAAWSHPLLIILSVTAELKLKLPYSGSCQYHSFEHTRFIQMYDLLCVYLASQVRLRVQMPILWSQ